MKMIEGQRCIKVFDMNLERGAKWITDPLCPIFSEVYGDTLKWKFM